MRNPVSLLQQHSIKKHLIACFTCCSLFFTLSAQQYNFEYSQQPYENLVGDSIITEGIPWYSEIWDIPLGFTFDFLGREYDHLSAANEELIFDIENEDYRILPYNNGYLLDRVFSTSAQVAQSPISIKFEGAPGNKIFKFQVRNAGFENGGEPDSVHFQIWLYETSNAIEFRYGPWNIESNVWDEGVYSPVIALASFTDSLAYLVSGPVAAPFISKLNPNDENGLFIPLSAPPPEGAVYRFTPVTSATTLPKSESNLEISPNPVAGMTQLDFPESFGQSHLQLFDLSGKLILEKTINPGEQLNLSALSPGLYQACVKSLNSDSSPKETSKTLIKL